MEHIPFFSITIPTRNRPKVLKLVLSSLKYQTFKDFEVIVSDNSDPEIQEKNYASVKKFKTLKIKYVRPPKVLNMPDNWEFGFSFAKGKYQGALEDKLLLRANALFELHEVLKKDQDIDLINHLHIGIEHYPNRLFKYKRIIEKVEPSCELVEPYSAKKELERKFNFEKNFRGDFTVNELRFFSFGKILFGFYSKELVKEIRERCGRIFTMICCDYTSSTLALYFSKKSILYNKELALGICNFKSGNWFSIRTKPGALLDYFKTLDPSLELLNNLPIPGLYSALHNLLAYDYDILKRNNLKSYKMNLKNLAIRCAEDLMDFPFSSEKEREEQTRILEDFAKKIGVNLAGTKKLPEWKSEKFLYRLYRFLFVKSFKDKCASITKRITCDLKYISLKSLLMR